MSESSERVDYLLRNYDFYFRSMSDVFNWFLITDGLIVNAYVQCWSDNIPAGRVLAAPIAILGMAISVVYLLIHTRSRFFIDVLEKRLKEQEEGLFAGSPGFRMALDAPHESHAIKHRLLFPLLFYATLAFFAFGLVAAILIDPRG